MNVGKSAGSISCTFWNLLKFTCFLRLCLRFFFNFEVIIGSIEVMI
jgi:hypothetical protein